MVAIFGYTKFKDGENVPEYAETYNKIVIEGQAEKEFEGEITAEDVREMAKEEGIKRMGVTDAEGNKLYPEDFPYSGEIVLHQVNKAGL
jgi:hypothetical protein